MPKRKRKKSLSAILKQKRLAAGYKTVYAAAKAIGLDCSQLYYYEEGRFRPKAERLIWLLNQYGVSREEIMAIVVGG